MLRTHYRSPLNFSYDSIIDAKNALTRIYQSLRGFEFDNDSSLDWEQLFARKFKQAMDDDFNTPLALSVIFEIVSELNKTHDMKLAIMLKKLATSIGLVTSDPIKFLQADLEINPEEIEDFIKQRQIAKQNKDFNLADTIRENLLAKGVILEDGKNGTIWRKC